MLTFKELRRAALGFGESPLKIAVIGDCATQFLTTALKGALAHKGISGQVFEAEYDQVSRQLLTADSDFRKFEPSIALVWETVERWWASGMDVQSRLAAVSGYASAFSGKLLYCNVAPFRDGVFGNYAASDMSMSVKIRAFNAGLDVLADKLSNFYVIDLNGMVADMGRNVAYDAPTYMMADMPLSPDAQAGVALQVADVIAALQGKVKKCVVVDLDNTLWGGVISEDGLAGIKIGKHDIGKAFCGVQCLLKRLKERGILLAVCSKNDEAIAKEPFERHPDMVLRMDDFACFIANWETKADNVAHIQKVLNIGMDSFVFLDDNPVEREMVRMAHPQVTVPELPEDPSLWVEFLVRENLFETVSYSVSDADRTRQYQVESQRHAFAASFSDEASFLANLQMRATCEELNEFTIPRAAQLSQRSNQFNVRTVRYTEAELLAYCHDPSVVQLGFTLEDRFGSHGLVSVLIAKIVEQDAFVDTWIMSCRVLKRGLEYYALNKLVAIIKDKGVTYLIGEYLPTKKNAMVSHLYEKMGFSLRSDGRYGLDLTNYQTKETSINENDKDE